MKGVIGGMSTREEIREGVLGLTVNWFENISPKITRQQAIYEAELYLQALHSQGVVIKDRRYGMGMNTRDGYNWEDVFFVIPLIEEESNGNNEVP